MNLNNNVNEKKKEWLTAQEVADDFFAGVLSYGRVLKMTIAGDLPGKKYTGRCYLYYRPALEQWKQENMFSPIWTKKKKAN